ncbi:PREDICTED: uncharacterized protein LOC104613531 [Nelumbo nucifera]|uniref:Uncharacterized protein LOC104613531 n=2 Tax=Nelumbo nucifera TaxID=4432 RepID=A0A1U8BQT1_NELNU|nr:PREDICTED: uncharacterized protein LOC104613531 [Nelumbo nucifera]DAD32882.1 TPA_asm: hypothetical protein HUJ06_011733 [Nelumbo nucifera]
MSRSSASLSLAGHLSVYPATLRRIPARIRRITVTAIASAGNGTQTVTSKLQKSNSILFKHSSVSSPTTHLARSLGFRPSPELGLISLLFVLSAAFGSIFSLGIISIPTMDAFRRLAASMDKLSKVISEEVPGTLSSLKLSGLEINDLTQQLSNLRQKISGNPYGKK